MENCDHTICPVLSILFYQFYDPAYKAWIIFELEASFNLDSLVFW